MALENFTNVTMNNITNIINVSSYPDLMVNINQIIYDGFFFFIMMFVLLIILFIAANKVKDQPLNNLMYSCAAVSIIGFLLRGICYQGNCLLNDHNMWVFPIMTAIFAMIIWMTKE